MLFGLQIYVHSVYDAVMTYPQAVFLGKMGYLTEKTA
jgi:hypothetical protein